jgi:hypothetical protein
MNTSKPTPIAILFTLAIVFLVSFHSFSQEQFKLSDYKNPEYRWQKLDLGFVLNGINYFDKLDFENGITEKRINSQFSNHLSADYYSSKNSASYQGFQDIHFSSGLGTNRMEYENLDFTDEGYTQKSRGVNLGLDATTINRFYNKKKMFIEADLNILTMYRRNVTENSADQESLPYYYKSDNTQYELGAGIPLLVGIGRIEEVQDARLAVYILEDLVSSGDIKRTPTNEEILAFSEFITQTKNKRYFDARLRKIAEITAIDSFLTVRGLKAESDASYYTLINDNWDFASGPVRSTGSRFSVGISPSMDFSFDENENIIRDTLNSAAVIENYSNIYKAKYDTWKMDFVTGYIWEKPANLYWQHTISANLLYSLYYQTFNMKNYNHDTLTYETESKIDSPNLGLNVGYKIGYYPNSRTQVTLDINSMYQQFWGNQVTNEVNEIDIGNIHVENDIQLYCYYYLSPQLRLSVDFSSIYTFTKQNQQQPENVTGDEIKHHFQNSFGAGLVYSIF